MSPEPMAALAAMGSAVLLERDTTHTVRKDAA